MENKRVAIFHDYLNQYGGGERVLEALHELFPDADIYTLMYDRHVLPQYRAWRIKTSCVQYFPFWRQKYQIYLALFPLIMKLFSFQKYDIIITSTHAWGNWLRKGDATLISYCHTPIRYFWDLYEEYRKYRFVSWVARQLMPCAKYIIRFFDKKYAQQVDLFMANSHEVQQRIRQNYNKDARVVHPPVAVEFFGAFAPRTRQDYYMVVARLKAYKRIDVIVKAFNRMQKRLYVVGTGPEEKKIRALAGPTVEIFSCLTDEELREMYAAARGYAYMAYEDFGMTMAEAQAAGVPVVAYAKGGACEIVRHNETGILYNEQTEEALINAVNQCELRTWDERIIRTNAERFSQKQFKKEVLDCVKECGNG